MFDSTIVDVAIGVVFVNLLLGLIVTAGTELISSWLNWRAKNLRAGVEQLLNSALAREPVRPSPRQEALEVLTGGHRTSPPGRSFSLWWMSSRT